MLCPAHKMPCLAHSCSGKHWNYSVQQQPGIVRDRKCYVQRQTNWGPAAEAAALRYLPNIPPISTKSSAGIHPLSTQYAPTIHSIHISAHLPLISFQMQTAEGARYRHTGTGPVPAYQNPARYRYTGTQYRFLDILGMFGKYFRNNLSIFLTDFGGN